MIKLNSAFKLNRLVLGLATLVFFVSCKSKKIVAENTGNIKLNSKTLVKNHYNSIPTFKTVRGRLKLDYKDSDTNMGHSVSFRMEKDKAIWISATLGIVKAYITPNRVSFYNRLTNEYFDGDFSYLSKVLGTEVDFEKVQNVLLGQSMFDLRKEKYNTTEKQGKYQLSPKKANKLFELLLQIEPQHYKVSGMQLTQSFEDRILDIQYKTYQQIENQLLPEQIDIYVKDKQKESYINLGYKNLEFDRKLKFPYKIPNGFDEISLE